jgi:GAF domain-containing protein
VLGVVDIRFDSANVSPDLISLIEGTVNRLAVSLENARLLEEIQFRAERERLIGEISSKVRSASDVDTVLRVAIQEIGQSLGVSEVMVQLRKDS